MFRVLVASLLVHASLAHPADFEKREVFGWVRRKYHGYGGLPDKVMAALLPFQKEFFNWNGEVRDPVLGPKLAALKARTSQQGLILAPVNEGLQAIGSHTEWLGSMIANMKGKIKLGTKLNDARQMITGWDAARRTAPVISQGPLSRVEIDGVPTYGRQVADINGAIPVIRRGVRPREDDDTTWNEQYISEDHRVGTNTIMNTIRVIKQYDPVGPRRLAWVFKRFSRMSLIEATRLEVWNGATPSDSDPSPSLRNSFNKVVQAAGFEKWPTLVKVFEKWLGGQ